MIEGICLKCGRRYYGWVLLQPGDHFCSKCGVALFIAEEGGKAIQGYSPFGAEDHKFKPYYEATPDPEMIKDAAAKKQENT